MDPARPTDPDPADPFFPERADHAIMEDRKSTRLNSSHRCISYAVFCLKKKKIGVSNLQSFIASMTQKLTLSDISDESKNYLDKAGITTACLRIKSKWTAGGKGENSTYPCAAREALTLRPFFFF